ncbi:hypothetical protein BD780_001154 [Clostridium tetanomorphum]|uniref:M50 family peptidase n=1 Tax=Clostridium tetanomorphum TaxID=1553 RepID=A0A923J1P2_CLOTT|nr:hypothetical protein [Clostridium tetanomorphum]KAJ52411.1 hypothetical protein CTM_07931 [Clostridium tetanomorphum DSM 665]MBC2397930.1 hypothetical protein [Clostridium tetanomorphum]MBP1864753.1 hypothetical protein [Clostridium tetanomorphum]NRS83929.1 hypothetical protein [Clostridium tetanomorphum]NRZ97148.1 hypothetical protein [Clostridium tetanomorphum]
MNKKLQKNKFKNYFKKIGLVILSMGIGGIVGILIAMFVKHTFNNINTPKDTIFTIMILIVLFVCTFILQLILHEVGHLLFGIWSGYEFISFRVGSLTFIKEKGKITLKKFKVMGTGGQCLMMPPEGNGYDCPYILYNLGGILINLLVSCLCIVFYILFPIPRLIAAFLIFTTISGIYDLIVNGIPMKINGIANDGHNIFSMKNDKLSRYSFYIQLRVNGLLHQGVRMKDMPLHWFKLPSGADLNDSLISSIKCLEANYYHDRKEFLKARECYESLLNNSPNLIKLFKNEINCELLFYEIMDECRKNIIDELYNKELKKYIKLTNCYISRKRLMYAYSVIIEKNTANADKLLKEIDIVKKTYPAKAEIESELEIIDFIKQKYLYNNK